MSTAGLFIINVNKNSRQRILLMRHELLYNRLRKIEQERCKRGVNPIPLLTDIEKTHELFFNSQFKPFVSMAYEYERISLFEGTPRLGNTVSFQLTKKGHMYLDMVIHIRLRGAATTSPLDKCRHVPFLGHHIIKNFEFRTENLLIDEYTNDWMTMYYNYKIKPDKRRQWKICVAQEVPQPASVILNPGIDNYREQRYILDGPQTEKSDHGIIDIWVPLLFWFNHSAATALPSSLLPHGQTFITARLAQATELAEVVTYAGPGTFTPPEIIDMNLELSHIYLSPRLGTIFEERSRLRIARIHRTQNAAISNSSGSVKLNELKYPTECLYFGLKLNGQPVPDRNKFHRVNVTNIPIASSIPNPLPPPTFSFITTQLIYREPQEIFTEIKLRTKGDIELYINRTAQFYSKYLSLYHERNSPEDIGLHIIPFNLYQNIVQPSGFIDFSLIKEETYIDYESNLAVGESGVLVVVAETINFIVISRSGTLSLRTNI